MSRVGKMPLPTQGAWTVSVWNAEPNQTSRARAYAACAPSMRSSRSRCEDGKLMFPAKRFGRGPMRCSGTMRPGCGTWSTASARVFEE